MKRTKILSAIKEDRPGQSQKNQLQETRLYLLSLKSHTGRIVCGFTELTREYWNYRFEKGLKWQMINNINKVQESLTLSRDGVNDDNVQILILSTDYSRTIVMWFHSVSTRTPPPV